MDLRLSLLDRSCDGTVWSDALLQPKGRTPVTATALQSMSLHNQRSTLELTGLQKERVSFRVSLELSACASKVKPTHLLETCCYSTCACMRALLTSQLYQLLQQFKKHLKTKFEKCTKLALIAGSKHTY